MFKYAIILMYILFSSCCYKQNKIIYRYKNIVITRVDACNKSSFFYGDKSGKIAGKIWVEYSGINDGFSGFLKFDDNGKVTLLSGDGYFKTEKLDTTLFEYKRILAHERPEIGQSICYISLATKYEREYNIRSKTGIKVEYDIK
jgi:hypothetical protein